VLEVFKNRWKAFLFQIIEIGMLFYFYITFNSFNSKFEAIEPNYIVFACTLWYSQLIFNFL